MCHFQAQYSPICPEQIFFGYNYSYFHLPIDPFHWAKFLKKSYSEARAMRMHHVWTENGPFAPYNFFLKTIINVNFFYLLASFVVQNFKKIARDMRMHLFWAQNSLFPQIRIFLQ